MNKKQKLLWIITILTILVGISFCFWQINRLEKSGFFNSAQKENTEDSDQKNKLVDLETMEEEKLYGKKQNVNLFENNYYYRDDIQNYLIIGTDASGNQVAESDEYRGAMADFLILVVVNHTNKTYSLIQINRDTMTEVALIGQDGTGEATATLQICTSHWYGGTKKQSCKNTVQAVSKLFGGIKIDAYYALDMKAIGLLNHAVGGITVTIQNDFSKIDPEMKLGETIKLTDKQAYHYVQTRYGVDGEDNVSRMKRQQEYMQGFAKQVSSYLGDNEFVISLYNQLQQNSTTNISGKDVNKIVSKTKSYKNQGIYTIDGKEKLGKSLGDGEDHVEFYLSKESLLDIMQDLYNLQQE